MIVVSSNADAGAGTLRQAIADATPGEEITFSIIGTITLTTGELLLSQDIVITGPGSSNLIVSGNNASRVFNSFNGVNSISGLTLANGNDTDGGGLHNEATLTLSDLIVRDCVASGDGGGIHNTSTIVAGSLQIHDCTATGKGGGIYNSGTYTDTGGIITVNTSSDQGGGIYSSGTFTMTLGIVDSNVCAGTDGGGAFNSGTMEFIETTLSANTADGLSNAAMNSFGTLTFTRTTVTAHSVPATTAVQNYLGTLNVDNSTFSGNTDAAAIRNSLGSISVANSTITLNGNGILQASGSILHIYDTILAGNFIDLDSDAGDVISDGNNLFGNTTNPITPGSGDQFGLDFAGLVIGPLQDNGGPTFTHALLPGSPALDAGNNTDHPATDQRGEPRIVNTTIDIGAFEAQEVVCLNFTGTLPAWLTIQGNCLVVTPNSFRGRTKAEANARAQAALDAFVAAAQESGDLNCDGPPLCAPPNFERQEYDTVLTLASEVSTIRTSGGDHYCQNIPVDLVAGQSVAIWQDSDDFDSYLYLIDPSSVVVAQDDSSGLFTPTSGDNAGITYTALVTGTYTVQATTYSAGVTGSFKLVISDGIEAAIGDIESAWVSIYVPSTQRIFVLSGYRGTDAKVFTIDSTNNTIINTVTIATVATIFSVAQPTLFYNAVDNSVWAASVKPSTVDYLFTRLNPTSGAILEQITFTQGVNYFAGYVPSQNKLYGNDGLSPTTIKTYDCATRTYGSTIPITIATTGGVYCKYIAEIDRVLVVGDSKYQLINPNDDTITAAVNQPFSTGIKGFYLDGLYYTGGATNHLIAIDLLTGTVSKDFAARITALELNPCRNEMMFSEKNTGSPSNYLDGSASLDFDVTESVIVLKSSATVTTLWEHLLWNPDTSRMYHFLASDTGIIDPSIGYAYVLS